MRHTRKPAPEASMPTGHTPSRRRPARRVLAAVTVAGAAVGLLPPAGAPAAGPRPFIEEVDRLERFPADARAALGTEMVPTWQTVTTEPIRTTQRVIAGTAVV